MNVRIGSTDDRRTIQWREHLGNDLRFGPALRGAEVRNGLIRIDPVHNLFAQVLVRKPKRVAGLMTDNTMKLRIGGIHCEAVEIHRWLARSNLEYVGAQV